MRLRTLLGMGAVALAAAAFADGDTSDAAFVYVEPDFTSFWHTATDQTVTLPITWPEGASTATLAVRGSKYSVDYTVTGDTFALTLPAAARESDEDVYALTLTFDDGTVRTARLGLIKGLMEGAEGCTRCCLDKTAAKWSKVYPHGVLPVPYGMTSFTVNGAAVEEGDAGFTGAQGWYALPNLAVGAIVPVSMTANGVTYDATLTIRNLNGLRVMVQ